MGVYELRQRLKRRVLEEAILAEIEPLKAIWLVCLGSGEPTGFETTGKVRFDRTGGEGRSCAARTLRSFWEGHVGTGLLPYRAGS